MADPGMLSGRVHTKFVGVAPEPALGGRVEPPELAAVFSKASFAGGLAQW